MREGIIMKDIVVASPALAVTSMTFLGYAVADWAALLSIVWIFILMVLKVSEMCDKSKN
jgi:hypothetical protein